MPKCSECGLMAVRDSFNGSVCEVQNFTRVSGKHANARGVTTDAELFCYSDSTAFIRPANIGPNGAVIPFEPEKLLPIINAENPCEIFRRYSPGKSPKEHEEMSMLALANQEITRLRERDDEREEKRTSSEAAWRTRVERNVAIRFWIGLVLTLSATVIASFVLRNGAVITSRS